MTSTHPLPMDRALALAFLHDKLASETLRKHSLASEAIMRRLAVHFGEDPDVWGLAGLLHDADLESIADDMTRHGVTTATWLQARGFPEPFLAAIRAHNGDVLGCEPEGLLAIALTAGESISGLISAAALIHPTRTVAAVKASSLRKRMKEKRFAANVDRARIAYHEKLGLSFEEFAELALDGMRQVAAELGFADPPATASPAAADVP